ncbi:hypothetical protein N2152v2_000407 [Parachlorella kessleri]
MAEEADVSNSGLASGDHDGEPPKPETTYGYKSQLKWTPELHARFVEAVERCGGHKNATPKQVQLHMNVEGVSVIHVKSHLQKHRLKMKDIESGGQARGANGGFLPPDVVPGAKRMRTSGSGLLESGGAGGSGRAGSSGGGDGGASFRPLPRSTLADLASGGDQLYHLTQAQQAGQPYPPFKPTAHLQGFTPVPALAQLPSLLSSAAAAAAGIDTGNWLAGWLAAGSGGVPALAAGAAAGPDGAAPALPAFSLPLPSPLAAPASYPAAGAAGQGGGEAGGQPGADGTAGGAQGQAPHSLHGTDGTPQAAAAAQLAMTGEGLQLLAQLAAASGVTPVAMAAAVAPGAQHVVGGGEGGEGGEGAGGVGAGSLEVIRACFSRLQGLLREQARLQQELNAVGEQALAQLNQLRSGLEAYFASVSAFASAIAMVQQQQHHQQQPVSTADAAGAADSGAAGDAAAPSDAQPADPTAVDEQPSSLTGQQGAAGSAAAAAGSDGGEKVPAAGIPGPPPGASLAVQQLAGPQGASLAGATPISLGDATAMATMAQLMPGALLYWGADGIAHAMQPAGSQHAQHEGAGAQGQGVMHGEVPLGQQAQQGGVLQQPAQLAALSELLKGPAEGA